jgi:hypothetical protein
MAKCHSERRLGDRSNKAYGWKTLRKIDREGWYRSQRQNHFNSEREREKLTPYQKIAIFIQFREYPDQAAVTARE